MGLVRDAEDWRRRGTEAGGGGIANRSSSSSSAAVIGWGSTSLPGFGVARLDGAAEAPRASASCC